MTNATELLNPSTPLAFLLPTLADEFELSRYLFVATLGAYVWDIALNLGNDYALLFKHRTFPKFQASAVLIRPRVFTLAFVLASFVYTVAPVKNCNALVLAYSICAILSQTATAMLFFLRVTAVWYPSKVAFAVFSILWIAVLGAGMSAPLEIRGTHIGPTMQCINTALPANIEMAAIIPLINDTAIFLAINYRILAHTIVADSFLARFRVFFGGRGLSTLSQALLRSGQHFYFIAVATHITLTVLLQLPRLTPTYRGMFTIPAFALVNAMACLVFRRIKFGLISSDGISNAPMTGLSENLHATANPMSLSLHSRRTNPTTMGSGSNTAYPLDVQVQKDIDKFENGADGSQEIRKPTTLA
ncbi:hypothetical protein MSAN_00588400 [Mycena sanguinolenta]|uniref:Uncharacterized protein n=1 Tax=Mycena sanguinolenta TaxID=230812 RepID=A0A8H7DHV8_9AGAR|nr:hypothetical protein MSAN_00588400 [Mycena sanguinolenta]